MHRVVVLALDGVYPFELGIPQRVFGSAGDRYEVVTCAVGDGPGERSVRTSADFVLTATHGVEALATADTVVIPPYEAAMSAEPLSAPAARALALIPAGARTVSICTAAFALAEAGLLDGRPATTHWGLAARFRATYPQVALDASVLFIDDGDILTSAGAASGVDACLHLVRKDHGSTVASGVARLCVVPPWREGGQAQYVEMPVPEPSAACTAATREWALGRLAEPLVLADLAAHARMSLRTFARRFQDEVGMSPGRWLIQQRVNRARGLLENSDLSVEQIAGRVGFATATSLRHHLHAAIGVSPQTYRRTFRAAAHA
ncbi:helix-turn-helix domain-containing protein [Streptomyces sp. HSW2009]|uniref:GlxA family transcriptional regulator n=1 Tax=Streptomyces sp. HSW2009 TaxID=3142890 RepID=UPI0032EF0BEA